MGGLFNREKTNPWIPRAEQAYEKSTFDSAATYYEKALEVEPTNNNLLIRLATCYKYIGKYSEAIATLEKLVGCQPENTDAWLEIAKLYGFAGNYASALEAISKVPDIESQPKLLEQVCRWLEHLNKRKEAATIAKKLVDSDPENAYYLSQYASLLLDSESYKEALDAYDTLSRKFGPKFSIYSAEAGHCCEMLGDLKSALERYQTIEEGNTGAWYHRARIEESLGLFKEAAASYAKISCYSSSNPLSTTLNRALTLLWSGNAKEALALVDKIITKGTQAPDLLYMQGAISFIIGELPRAIESFNAFLHSYQGNQTVWFMKGSAEFLSGKFKDAVQSFTKMNRLGVGSSEMFASNDEMELFDEIDAPKKVDVPIISKEHNECLMAMQANSLFVLGYYSEADKLATNVLSDTPNRTDMQILHARCLANMGKYESAEDSLTRAASIVPDDFLVQYEYASLEMLLGNYRNALQIFEKLLKTYPGNTILTRNIIHCSLALDDITSSKKLSEDVLKITSGDAATIIAAGDVAYISGDYKEAAHYYELASQSHPELAIAYYGLGKAYSATGDLTAAKEAFTLASQYTRENVGMVRQQAQVASQSGDYEEALALYSSILKECPNAHGLHTEVANLYYKLGNWSEALTNAETALSSGDNNYSLYCLAGDAATQLEKYDTAIGYYKKALEINPDNLEVAASLGHVYALTKENEEAIRYLTPVLEQDPNNRFARKDRASAEANLGRVNEALEDYTTYYENNPDEYSILIQIADLLEQKQNIDELREVCEKYLEYDSNNVIILEKLSSLYRISGNYNEAIILYNKILETNPNDLVTLYNKEKALLTLGNYEEASAICEQLLSVTANNDIRMDYANSLANTGKSKEAISEYAVILKEDRNNLAALYPYANLLSHIGEYKRALATYEYIIRSYPEITTAYIERAYVALKLGNIEQTITCMKDAATTNPNNPFILSGIAYLYFAIGQQTEALQYLDRAEASGATDADSYSTRAFIYLSQNKYDLAEKAATNAVKIQPTNPLAWSMKAKAEDALGKRKKALASYSKLVELEEHPLVNTEAQPRMPTVAETKDDAFFEDIEKEGKTAGETIQKRKYQNDTGGYGASKDDEVGRNKGKYSGGIIIN